MTGSGRTDSGDHYFTASPASPDERRALDVTLAGGVELLADHVGMREGKEAAEEVGTVDREAPAGSGGSVTLTLAPESWSAWYGTATRTEA